MEKKIWEKYKLRIKELEKLIPNAEFEGVLINKEGNPIDCLILFGYASNLVQNTKLEGEYVLPRVIYSISPIPNAFAMPSGEGYLKINLGIALAVFAFPCLTALIEEILKDTKPKSMDFIENIQISSSIIDEIDNVVYNWREAAINNWDTMNFPSSSSFDNRSMGCNLNSIIVYHEFGHLLELYKPQMYKKRINYVSNIVNEWIKINYESLSHSLGSQAYILKNNQVIDNWIRELDADRTGYGTLFNTEVDKVFGLNQSKIMQYQASMALYYFLLELLEFTLFTVNRNYRFDTHPPVYVRRELFISIEAANYGVDKAEFVTKYWGAGYIMYLLFSRIFDEFINGYGKKYLKDY